jgi:hypothetical protein
MKTSMKVLYITLFEKNLIRSYLQSDDGSLIKKLLADYKVVIITSSELLSLVSQSLNGVKDENLSFITFGGFKPNFAIRICQSIMSFMPHNKVVLLAIYRQYFIDRKKIKKMLRVLIYKFSRRIFIRKLVRRVYKFALKEDSIKKCLSDLPIFSEACALFVTSLAALRGEDPLIAILFQKNNVPVIGTIRSWDNLSVDGLLKMLPDKFLYQSNFTLEQGLRFQDIPKEQMLSGLTPAYRDEFLPSTKRTSNSRKQFAYMCMGESLNPDEPNFINWLVKEWIKVPKHFNLFIVQHPAFKMNLSEVDTPANVKIVVFDFSSTSLIQYYSFLYEMDLVFGVGTTGILDAAYVDVPVLAIKFEIVPQNFWRSGLRYHDYFEHTSSFFRFTNIEIVDSKEKTIEFILNHENIPRLDRVKLKEFIGPSKFDYHTIIMNSIVKLA